MLVMTRREGEEVVIGDPAAPLDLPLIEQTAQPPVNRREVADKKLKDDEGPADIAGQIGDVG